jgi:pimeloyl-ACP methyl ester carboxylesterase
MIASVLPLIFGGISVLLIGILGLSFYIALSLIHPKKRSIEETKQLELERTPTIFRDFETWEKIDQEVTSNKGYVLKGWCFPAPGKKAFTNQFVVVIVHGFSYTHHGSVKYASIFRNLGMDVIMYDQPNHGGSGGTMTSMGFQESIDVQQWISLIKELYPNEVRIGLCGESMGAASCLIAQSRTDQIIFTVSDCSFSTLKQLMIHQLKHRRNIPLFPFYYVSNFFFRMFSGAYYESISPKGAVRNAKAPILFCHGLSDSYIPPHHSEELHHACKSPSMLYLAGNESKHAQAFRNNQVEYTAFVHSFLKEVVGLKIEIGENHV